jgi:hypothetical protein
MPIADWGKDWVVAVNSRPTRDAREKEKWCGVKDEIQIPKTETRNQEQA